MSDQLVEAVRAIAKEEIAAAFKSERAEWRRMIETAIEEHLQIQSFNGLEPTWTTKQAAAYLGIARSTLYNLISQGRFPRPRKQGRTNAFVPSEVAQIRRQWLELGVTE